MVFILYTLSGCAQKKPADFPKAQKGVIDLSSWDFDRDPSVTLKGEWEFYDRQLLSPQDLVTNKEVFFSTEREENLEFNGFATYHIQIHLGQTEMPLNISFYSDNFIDCRLWMDDKLCFSRGIVKNVNRDGYINTSLTSDLKHEYLLIPPSKDVVDLTLQVSSIKKTNVPDIVIETEKNADIHRSNSIMKELFIIAFLLFAALYHFILYIFRKRDVSTLFFGSAIIFYDIYILLRNYVDGGSYSSLSVFLKSVSDVLGEYFFVSIISFIIALCTTFLSVFIHTLFPKLANLKFILICCFINILSSVPYFFITSAGLITNIADGIQYISIIIVTVYNLTAIVRAWKLKESGANFIFYGLMLLLVALINDMLTLLGIINSPNMSEWGILAYIFFQSAAIAYRFSQAYNNAEFFSGQLENTLDNLKALIKKSKQTSEITDNSVKELVDMVGVISQSSKELTSAFSSISAGSNIQIDKAIVGINVGHTLSQFSEEIRNNADAMKQSAMEVIKMSDKGTVSIANLSDMQHKNHSYMNSMSEAVNSLVRKTNDIVEFSDTILNIAKETKLLALNASVEAAKAGESGKGFRIIAMSIQKLAEKSDIKAKEINNSITEIIGVTQETINKLIQSNEVVNEQSIIVDKTVEMFQSFKETISASIDQINHMYGKISELLEIRDIVIGSMDEISKVTNSNSAITQEVCATIQQQMSQLNVVNMQTRKLKEESENLASLINSIKA